jgi:hypothetical protein
MSAGETMISGTVPGRDREEIAGEVREALNALHESEKHHFDFLVSPDDEAQLLIRVNFGENQQIIRMERKAWMTPGAIRKAIVEHLNI